MQKKYAKSLFVFRRDLRLEDNTGLINALKNSKTVLPCFIFDPRQILNNKYKSKNAIEFMIESLIDLDKELHKKKSKLHIFSGIAEKVIEKLIKQEKIEAVYINKDHTPFSKKRDKNIQRICTKYAVKYLDFDDALLTKPGSVLKDNGSPYTVFTPFYKKALAHFIQPSQKNHFKNYYKGSIKEQLTNTLKHKKNNSFINGGRKNCLRIIRNLNQYENYNKVRNFPAKDRTTKLSAHLKFGTCSVREVYYAIKQKLGHSHPLLRQLYWRDFFTNIAFHFPYVFGKPFYRKFEKLKWQNNKNKFKAWCLGKTGFPIIDAAMRELNRTGFMHNRTRMVVSSFLVKDLHIDWQWGEKYFAQKLVDYDPSVNNGNWQWAASTGCDAQPYFRIFNPWIQQKKFDPGCKYIKQWIPELRSMSNKEIHSLEKKKESLSIQYPLPIIDHKVESKIAKLIYRKSIK